MVQEKLRRVCGLWHRSQAWVSVILAVLCVGLTPISFAQEVPVRATTMTAITQSADSTNTLSRIPLHQALELYFPANYQFKSDGVDLSTEILYDTLLPWTEALSKGLAGVGLEMQTNLFKRIVVIKKSKAGTNHALHAVNAANTVNTTNTEAFLPIAPTTTSSRISIQQALAKYVPDDYGISIANEIDPKTLISYDASLPWLEALGKGLTAVGLDVNANMYKKNIAVTPFQTTLADIIEKQVPADYKVFVDAGIQSDTRVRYAESATHWIEALSKGAMAVGLDVTVNVTRKVVFIRPVNAKSIAKGDA